MIPIGPAWEGRSCTWDARRPPGAHRRNPICVATDPSIPLNESYHWIVLSRGVLLSHGNLHVQSLVLAAS